MSKKVFYSFAFVLLSVLTLYAGINDVGVQAASLNGTLPGGTLPPATSVTLAIGTQQNVYRAGEVVVFDISVENITTEDIHNVSIDVTVPAYGRFVGAQSTPGWQEAALTRGSSAVCPDNAAPGTVCTYSIGTLPASTTTIRGLSQSISFAIKLDDVLPLTLQSFTLPVQVEGAELTEPLSDNTTGVVHLLRYLLLPIVVNP